VITSLPGAFEKGGRCHRTLRTIVHWKQEEEKIFGEEVTGGIREARKNKWSKQPWTLAQGFYAQMGGFCLDTFEAHPEVLHEGRMALNLESFRYFLWSAAAPLHYPEQIIYGPLERVSQNTVRSQNQRSIPGKKPVEKGQARYDQPHSQ
jgi:hypothetical protein